MQPPARICLSDVFKFNTETPYKSDDARKIKKPTKKHPFGCLNLTLLKSQNFDKYHHSLKRREDNTIVPKKSEFWWISSFPKTARIWWIFDVSYGVLKILVYLGVHGFSGSRKNSKRRELRRKSRFWPNKLISIVCLSFACLLLLPKSTKVSFGVP